MWRRLGSLLSLLFPLLVLILLKRYAAMPASAALALKLYPAVVNAVFLVSFSYSLWRPPSMIERLAALREPNLSPRAKAYTRKVTLAWCVFFFFNGLAALATALWMSNSAWALYNGFIAYALMACLFSIEWILRQKVKRHDQV